MARIPKKIINLHLLFLENWRFGRGVETKYSLFSAQAAAPHKTEADNQISLSLQLMEISKQYISMISYHQEENTVKKNFFLFFY
jgi:hypothetical protein